MKLLTNSTYSELKQSVEFLRKENSTLESLLDHRDRQLADLRKQRDDFQKQVKSSLKDFMRKQDEVLLLKKRINSLIKVISSLEGEIKMMRKGL